jgi:peptidase C25-like protein
MKTRTTSRLAEQARRSAHIKSMRLRPALMSLSLAILAAIMMLLPSAMQKASAARGPQSNKRQVTNASLLAPIPTPVQSKTVSSALNVLPALPSALQQSSRDDDDGDADIPPRAKGRINKETYLALRDEHINSLRGLDLQAKSFDPRMRSTAIRQMEQQERAMMNSPTVSSVNWTEIGPAPVPNGQTQQFPATAPVTGRATMIVVDPTNSNKVYMGTAQGGVWRSTDGGTNWKAIFDTAQTLAIGAIALAPSDPTKLYVGTGEPNNSADSFFGVGVYRIDNADTTADLVGPINPSFTFSNGSSNITTTCFGGRAISAIVVHPTDPATIFVSTAAAVSGAAGNAFSNLVPPLGLRGVYRSTNATAAAGAVTFAKLLVTNQASLDVPGTGNTSIFDMVLEPGNPDNLLVGVSGAAAPGGGVFRSTNAQAATPTFTGTLTPGFTGLTPKLAINKVGAVVTVFMADNEPSVGAGCGSQAGRVRKSTDAGVTWSTPLAAAEGYCGSQCAYDNPVGIHPNDANIVYLGGNARGTCQDVLQKSTDGGATFIRDDTGLHADSHYIFFDTLTNPATVWFVTDGGVTKRQDSPAGTAWMNQNTTGLGTLQFISIGVHPTDQFMTIGGTQDNGTEAQITSSGNWVSAESGDGGFALIDQSATDTINVTMYHTFFNQANNFIGFDRTNLGACLAVKDSWEFRGAGFANDPTPSCDGTAFTASNGINVADTVLFYAPMALGPGGAGNPNTLYFGTNKIYRSTDRGDTMTAVSQTLVAGVAVSAIGISPQNDNVRVVGLRNGSVFATTTGSNPLTNTAFPVPTNATGSTTNRHVSRAVIDPTNSNTAYVTLAYYTDPLLAPAAAGQIWRTTNLNAATPTYTSIGNTATGLPNVPVNGFAIDASDPTHPGVSVLYAGSDIGVYTSTDSGATWAPFGLGLPRVSVFDMAIQPTSRILRIATHGRGMWEIALPGSPTAAKLEEFAVKGYSGGQFIQWKTAYETNNLGFNLHREEGGKRTRITPQVVAGSALVAGNGVALTAGRSYAWWDKNQAGKGVLYWLEEIGLDGVSTWHGPVSIDSVGGSPPAMSQADLLSRVGAPLSGVTTAVARAADIPKGAPVIGSPQVNLAASQTIKLSVQKEGLYRASQADLAAAGLSPTADPRFLQLFVDGVEQAIKVTGEQDGKFDPSDAVEFYATGLDTPYSDARVYWLVAGSSGGKRIGTAAGGKSEGASGASFPYTVERRDRTLYFSSLKNGEKENFFGPVVSSDGVDQSVALRMIDRGAKDQAVIEVALQGVTYKPHQVRVSLNGSSLGDVSFANQAGGAASFTVSPSQLVEGDNRFTLIAVGSESDVSLINYIRVTYRHAYTAESNNLRLTATGGQPLTISGFTNNQVRVLDITNAAAVQEVAGAVKPVSESYAVTATAPGSGQRQLLALTGDQVRKPSSVAANLPSSLRQASNGADLLVITRREYFNTLGPLVSLRQSQGLAVTVVDVEDIYDEWSYGLKTPQAIKDFLSYAKTSWKRKPGYVLFAGHASFDGRNYLGYGDFDRVPSKLLDTSYMETFSDDWFADFNGDGLAEMAVGRLSFRTFEEAAAIVSKITGYEKTAAAKSVLLVSDRPDGFNFRVANDRLKPFIPVGMKIEEVDRATLGDTEARARLLEAINQGPKIVNYTGHGSVSLWRGNLLTVADAAALTNRNLSLFVTMTCLNGYLGDPVSDSLAESLVKANRAGAVAAWASSGLTAAGSQSVMDQEMFRLLFGAGGQAMRLGDATMKAKAATLDGDVRRTWILFGDPTMRLK